jgi:hypothetical protein
LPTRAALFSPVSLEDHAAWTPWPRPNSRPLHSTTRNHDRDTSQVSCSRLAIIQLFPEAQQCWLDTTTTGSLAETERADAATRS